MKGGCGERIWERGRVLEVEQDMGGKSIEKRQEGARLEVLLYLPLQAAVIGPVCSEALNTGLGCGFQNSAHPSARNKV